MFVRLFRNPCFSTATLQQHNCECMCVYAVRGKFVDEFSLLLLLLDDPDDDNDCNDGLVLIQ